MGYKTYKDIPVWQIAHEFVMNIYKISADFPDSEKFGITSQLRRAAHSIAANIVEGVNRRTTKDLLHFLVTSRASLAETEYYLLLSKDLGYIDTITYKKLLGEYQEIHKQLSYWMSNLRKKGKNYE